MTTVSLPVSIGFASRVVISNCVRKWAEGAALAERERQIVAEALAHNRFEMIQAVFAEREEPHVQS
ncbi:MAG TPA: hypothetical protein VK181_07675 [Rhizobium sp.]|nr:hypothetical protein [Rhizobium sp.]